MPVSGPLKYHGGKAYLASRIVALLPPHLHYVEPYFGGGAVLLAKSPEGVSEVVNDLNEELTNFWIVLQHPTMFQRFCRQCEATPFSEQDWDILRMEMELHYRNCQLADVNEEPHDNRIYRAHRFFVVCRQSLAGRMKSFTGITKTRTRRGMNNEVSAWLTAIEGLPAVHARLKRVLILNRDALDVIRSQDGPDTLQYIDPPYMHETRATTADYAHEMTVTQHMELLGVLATLKGKFVLSGYRSELYDSVAETYEWCRRDFKVPNHAAGGAKKRTMTESVWMNFTPP